MNPARLDLYCPTCGQRELCWDADDPHDYHDAPTVYCLGCQTRLRHPNPTPIDEYDREAFDAHMHALRAVPPPALPDLADCADTLDVLLCAADLEERFGQIVVPRAALAEAALVVRANATRAGRLRAALEACLGSEWGEWQVDGRTYGKSDGGSIGAWRRLCEEPAK